MSCNRDRFINRTGQVMGEFGAVEIALRGPGCINGTGRCNVAGASGRCTDRFGMGNDYVNSDNVMGTGGRRCERFNDEVQGTGGRRCDSLVEEVLEAAGKRRNHNNNVMGTGGRRDRKQDCCDFIWSYLETPFTVPR